MVISGVLPWVRGLLLFPAQLLGGMVAAALVKCMFPGPLDVETTLNDETSIVQGVFIEMFLTIELVITVLFLAAEKWKATFIAPVGIGLALFVAELTGWCPMHDSSTMSMSTDECAVRGLLYWRFFKPD